MPAEIKIDLHDIYSRGDEVERALNQALAEARRTRARRLQIVHGKGSGQLKRLVQRFLQRGDIRAVTRKVDNDARNWGRLTIHFRWPD